VPCPCIDRAERYCQLAEKCCRLTATTTQPKGGEHDNRATGLCCAVPWCGPWFLLARNRRHGDIGRIAMTDALRPSRLMARPEPLTDGAGGFLAGVPLGCLGMASQR